MTLLRLNLAIIAVLICTAKLYDLGVKNGRAEYHRAFRGKIVGFPKDGAQIQSMLGRDVDILQMLPQMYYVDSPIRLDAEKEIHIRGDSMSSTELRVTHDDETFKMEQPEGAKR